MEDICRLCLLYSPEMNTVRLENSEILGMIQSILIKITINENLPNKICVTCSELLKQFSEYHTKVCLNQKILERYLNKGQDILNNFYFSIKNNFGTKPEVKEILLVENKENDETHIPLHLAIMDVDDKETEINQEINNFTEKECSSEDEVSISSIRKEKDITYTTKTKEIGKKKILNTFSRKPIKKTLSKTKLKLNNSECETNKQINVNEHKCLTCFSVYNTQNHLIKHYKEHNTKQNRETQTMNYEILDHESNKKIFKCKKCERKYDNMSGITRHMVSHTDRRPFICNLCGRTYKTVSEIIRHGRAHNGVKINCSYMCGYSTAYMGALKEHEKRHNNEFKYKCDKCEKGFLVKTWFLEHQNIHNGLKPFVCDICGLAFHMNRYLATHKSTVHPQSSDLKRYICIHCSLPCDSMKALTEHHKVHGIKSTYLCDICGKTLSNSEQLKIHRRVHLGVKPFTCGICNKSFSKKFNMTLHERTHTGAKDYECTSCGKHYSQKSTLRRHFLRTHTDEKKEEK